MQSTETIVQDPASNRIHYVQTVKRKPEAEAWSATDANRVSILPWGVDSNGNPCEKNCKDLPKPICVQSERPDVPADDPDVHRPGGGHPRRIYITRSDMLAHGFTDVEVEEYREAFGLFDQDGGGTITAVEIGTVVRSIGPPPPP